MPTSKFLCYACNGEFTHSSSDGQEILNCILCGSDVIEKLEDVAEPSSLLPQQEQQDVDSEGNEFLSARSNEGEPNVQQPEEEQKQGEQQVHSNVQSFGFQIEDGRITGLDTSDVNDSLNNLMGFGRPAQAQNSNQGTEPSGENSGPQAPNAQNPFMNVASLATNLLQGLGNQMQHPAHSGQGPNLVSLNHNDNMASADPVSDSNATQNTGNLGQAITTQVNIISDAVQQTIVHQQNGPVSIQIASVPLSGFNADNPNILNQLLGGLGGPGQDIGSLLQQSFDQAMNNAQANQGTPVSAAYLDRLRAESAKKVQESDEFKDKDCQICFEKADKEILVLPCNHMYCGGCLTKWFETHDTCPVCRAKMPAE